MKTVLILSRGRRLSAIFGRLAKDLSRHFRVVVVFRVWNGYAHDPRDWADIDGLVSYDLGEEIAKRQTGDLRARIQETEQATGISAYKAASNYLLYRRFAKDYFGTWPAFYSTEDEILREFVGSFSLAQEIFARHSPDLVFCETPDLISHRVVQAVAFRRGVFTLGFAFNNVFGDGFVNFTFGCNYRNPVLEYFSERPEALSESAWDMADALITRVASGVVHDAAYIRDYKRRIQSRKLSSRFVAQAIKRGLSLTGVTEVGHIIRRQLVGSKNRRWLNRNLSYEIPKDPYVLVSLHYQPEASTCLAAARWIDQDKIVEQLAINAPAGIRIAVKENPRKFGLRGRKYYESLKDLPNVDLIHPLVSNDALIRGATAILSITGTVGLEGIALAKRVAVLGRPSYDRYQGVRKIDYPEDIFEHLADSQWNPEGLSTERRSFLAALAESVIFFGPSNNGDPWPLPEHAGPNLAWGVERFIQFAERTRLKVDGFAPIL